MIPRTAARPLSLALLATLLAALAVLAPAGLPQARAKGYNTGRTAPSMLVVDGSGSMRADDVGGRARMDVAKEALSTLVPMLARGRERGPDDLRQLRSRDRGEPGGRPPGREDPGDARGPGPPGARSARSRACDPPGTPRSACP
ncbi:VWA domain-containing protein [Brachybacterium sp. GPGPB12]|uniref:VWA domain-containing protein n=1 Tax=Brachybacterium sp. GPGPB12 TaxID=3023517 RepID=UPI0031343C87